MLSNVIVDTVLKRLSCGMCSQFRWYSDWASYYSSKALYIKNKWSSIALLCVLSFSETMDWFEFVRWCHWLLFLQEIPMYAVHGMLSFNVGHLLPMRYQFCQSFVLIIGIETRWRLFIFICNYVERWVLRGTIQLFQSVFKVTCCQHSYYWICLWKFNECCVCILYYQYDIFSQSSLKNWFYFNLCFYVVFVFTFSVYIYFPFSAVMMYKIYWFDYFSYILSTWAKFLLVWISVVYF